MTPLRKWETEKEELLEPTSFKLAREEVKKLIVQSFPTILATVVIVGIIIVDFSCAGVLKTFQEQAKIGISFPCLPSAKQTDATLLGPIFTILVVCFISCVVEAYFSRLRAIICSMFYSKRANERAKYLYK